MRMLSMTNEPGEHGADGKKGLEQRGPAQPVERDDPATGSAPRHTPQGAPTDAAHQDAGDGALTGSVPAGLTIEEMADRARESGRDDAGAE